MYAWKCWRETRARFVALLILFVVIAILVTLAPGLKERNGWWYFDRSEYRHDLGLMSLSIVGPMILSALWGSGCLSAAFLGITSPGSELEPGTIEYLWTRPRSRAFFHWTHWGICVAEMIAVAIIPTYVAAALLGALTGYWDQPLLLVAPWLFTVVALPILGLATLMTAVRRSASGGLVLTGGIFVAYVFLRQIATGPMHLNLPPLFMGSITWLMTYYSPFRMLFPWGSFARAIVCAVAFPLAAQYLLRRAEA